MLTFHIFSHPSLAFMMPQNQCTHQGETYHHRRLTIARSFYIFIYLTSLCIPLLSIPGDHNFLPSNLQPQYHYVSFLMQIVDSIISHGSFVNNAFIEHSVVGIRSRINSNVHLKVWCNHSTIFKR